MKWVERIKATAVFVAAFLVLFFTMRACEAETIAEVAPATFIAGNQYQGGAITAVERFGRYDFGVTLMSELQCDCRRGDSPGNLGVHVVRTVAWKRLELGLGAAYWQNQTPAWSSNTTFSLHWGLTFGDWSIRHRHYSTGGASERNGGLDVLAIGYRFR